MNMTGKHPFVLLLTALMLVCGHLLHPHFHGASADGSGRKHTVYRTGISARTPSDAADSRCMSAADGFCPFCAGIFTAEPPENCAGPALYGTDRPPRLPAEAKSAALPDGSIRSRAPPRFLI